jgi:hypothetical protein
MKKILTSFFFIFIVYFVVKAVPILNSNPSQTAKVIYLDFDGQAVQHPAWQNGNAFTCAASVINNYGDEAVSRIFNVISEDFRPFNVNITTDESIFLAANVFTRMRVIITSTLNWNANPGVPFTPDYSGSAISNSFYAGNNTPCFVFDEDILSVYDFEDMADLCSHQIGHTLGLSDIGKFNTTNCATPINYFHPSIGTGDIDWVPIMGAPFYAHCSRWVLGKKSIGPCTNIEDQLAILATGLGYRVDDYVNIGTPALPNLLIETATTFTKAGIIETNTDKDVFKLTITSDSKINFSVIPNNKTISNNDFDKANLDVVIKVYNSANNLLVTFEPSNIVSVFISDLYLTTGTYYFEISGGANTNSITNYGSLGGYNFVGNLT